MPSAAKNNLSETETDKPALSELDALVEKAVVGGEKDNEPENFAEKAERAAMYAPEKSDIS